MDTHHAAADAPFNPSAEIRRRRRCWPGGTGQLGRLDTDRIEIIRTLQLIDEPAQLDAMFDGAM